MKVWVLGILICCASLGAVAAHYFSEPFNRELREVHDARAPKPLELEAAFVNAAAEDK